VISFGAGVEKKPLGRRVVDWLVHPLRTMKEMVGGDSTYPLLALFGLALFDSFDRSAVQVLSPEIRDAFGWSDTQMLLLISCSAIIGLGLTIPIAILADRGKRVRLMVIGALLFSAFSIGTGLVPLVWWALLFTRAGASIGQATVFPTHNSLLSDYYDIPYRPAVFSIHRAAESIGQFVGPVTVGLVGQAFGWRVPFIILTIPCVVIAIFAIRLREPSRGHFERRAMGADDEVSMLDEAPPSFEESWRMVWKIESLRRIYYAVPFLAVAFVGFGYLANLLYEREFGLDAAQRGLYETLAEPAQLVGLVLSATYGLKLLQKGPSYVIRFTGWVSAVAAGFAAIFALSPNVWLTVVARMGIAASLAAVLPSVFAALSLAIPARARASGFSIAVVFVIPGLLILPIAGWMSENWGIKVGMLLMAPVFVIAGLIVGSAHKVIDRDIKDVWTSTAARSELLYERRQGNIKQLLCRNVDVKYGDVQILFGVDFEVSEGEIIALLGTNGAGKSTLLKAICGVVEASNGAIIFDGRDITHAPPHEIAALGIAMVPGGQGVFPSLSVGENLRVSSWLDRKRKIDPAPRLAEVLEMFPILRDRMDEPAANLSGGQQQMLALGMAFLSKPKLLAIDELSLGLAPVIVEQLLPIVRRIAEQGTTVILVEQSVNVALTLAQTAVFMEKGEIRFRGPTADLLDRPDVLRSVFLEGASKGLADHAGGVGDGTGTPTDSVPSVVSDVRTRETPLDDHAVPALEVVDLSVRFGGIRAVDGVSFKLRPGEVIGIIGPNGAGKTTLFDLISGFTSADTGRVLLDGTDLSRLAPNRRAWAGLGRSFQDARLFPALTVEETIAVALERWLAVKDPLNAALRLPAFQDAEDKVAFAVDELIELMGIESFRTKFVHELSTGSRRVVDLACVVAHHPAVVLLDEPSSGIAQRESEALGPLILRIRDTLQASIIVIEHDMPLISSVSDRLVALDQGHVVTIGSPADVLAHPEVVASYLGNSDEVIQRSGSRTAT